MASNAIYIEAINQAIIEEMARDESVFIMGEDIRRSVYGATAGLFDQFGERRVLDTPLSENGFFGAAIGSSLVGMRPIVETLTSFMWVAMDQLVSQAAKMRYMFGGQATLPVVFRATMFYGGGSAAHHSDRSYPMFMNMPGFKILVPSTPRDAKGLLKTAIRDNDPCISFEDGTLGGLSGRSRRRRCWLWCRSALPMCHDPGPTLRWSRLRVRWPMALRAAEELEEEGVSVEVIDPRTLVPLDKAAILESVAKTGRLVVADPAHKVCSAASEIASIVSQEGFWDLQAPITEGGGRAGTHPRTPRCLNAWYTRHRKRSSTRCAPRWRINHAAHTRFDRHSVARAECPSHRSATERSSTAYLECSGHSRPRMCVVSCRKSAGRRFTARSRFCRMRTSSARL